MTEIVLLKPDWQAPTNVVAYTSCRAGGQSLPPFDSFNVAQHVGDDPDVVELNRHKLPNQQNFVWLQQVHSNLCLELPLQDNSSLAVDAVFTQQAMQVCAVMTADCLPILLCDKQGTRVAAVHAGWRGLADGIIENSVQQMNVSGANLLAWLGPAISQQCFEVGKEVYQVFSAYPQAFVPSANSTESEPKYLADLYAIARSKLKSLGIDNITGGDFCTYSQESLFFSHRRATHQGLNTTGRMVSAIYLR
mgnify:CR=1 FL=1